jgi:hypothetical protein
VNRSGSEYQCTKLASGIFDGPSDSASLVAMRSWNLNAVRVPLNESCWLGLSSVSEAASGAPYRQAIIDYVGRLESHGLIPILELHWAAPGDLLAAELWPMPNADHSEDFWRDVASTFGDDDGVIFVAYNEPYPDSNQDTDAAWDCWLNGCQARQWGATESYEAVGMQALVDAVRETGAPNIILLGGVQYSNDVSEFLAHLPVDPLENIGAAWHAYNFNECVTEACWNDEPGTVAAELPVVATEIGQADCTGSSFLKPLMTWLDTQGIGYLAWSWNTSTTPCTPRSQGSEGAPWALITDYTNPEPYSAYAATFRDHVAGL